MPASSTPILPAQTPFRVIQTPGKPHIDWAGRADDILVIIPKGAPAKIWSRIPEGTGLRKLEQQRGLKDKILRTRRRGKAGNGIVLGRLDKASRGFELLTAAGALATEALREQPGSLALVIEGFDSDTEREIVAALLLALAARNFHLPEFKQKPAKRRPLKTVRIGCRDRLVLERCLAEADGLNLARWLTALPPNVLDAGGYVAAVRSLAREHGWKMDFLNTQKLAKAGAGAFLAVAQGNADKDAGIVHLRYRPKGSTKQPKLALVGKGIIFDTGGTNLKPFQAMLDMHCDMAGSAVALATLKALTAMDFPEPVDCWLAITENRISNTAYKSRDVVTASNGVTIEVIHTDAEGRMALADTLALAGREQPAAILDFATLTGSCVTALTDRYSGALSNRQELDSLIISAGRACGERVWPFPLDDDFDEEIKSSVADVLQCAAAGGGDHIQAARFLRRFVPDTANWIHVDLSAATRKGGLAQVPTEITGFGVRYALSLILDNLDELTLTPGKRGKARQG